MRPRGALLFAAGLAACSSNGNPGAQDDARASSPIVAAASEELVARGRTIAVEYECVRCHAVPGLDPAAPDKDCVGCHQRIEAGTYEAPPEALAEWQEHVEHLKLTPDLAGATRLRRSWIEAFLLQPHDVRPGLAATMPRLDLEAGEAAALAAFLSPAAETDSSGGSGDTKRGRALFVQHECTSCHAFSGSDIERGHQPDAEAIAARRLAPDLRHARDRLRPDVLVDWLVDPRRVHAATAMPPTGLTDAQARDVAQFLITTTLSDPERTPVPERLPLLERPVAYAEVERQVLRRTCWHCHSDPDFAPGGDGGPGNSGGLGFAGRGLDLSSLAAMSSGAKDDDGQRRSIFRKLDDGTPALVAHLYARHLEQSGRRVDGVRGMPLGLPALSLQDIQLVESWIAQGRPG